MKLTNKKIDWNKEPTKREKAMFVFLMFAVIVVFIVKIWSPSGKAISAVKGEIKKGVSEQRQLESSLDAVSGMAAGSPERGKKARVYEEWAAKAAASPEVFLMKALTSPMMLKGLEMPDISFEETKSEGGVKIKSFKVLLKGSFIAVNGYLKRVSELPMLLVIDSVNIKLDNKSSGHVVTEIEGVVYGW